MTTTKQLKKILVRERSMARRRQKKEDEKMERKQMSREITVLRRQRKYPKVFRVAKIVRKGSEVIARGTVATERLIKMKRVMDIEKKL